MSNSLIISPVKMRFNNGGNITLKYNNLTVYFTSDIYIENDKNINNCLMIIINSMLETNYRTNIQEQSFIENCQFICKEIISFHKKTLLNESTLQAN